MRDLYDLVVIGSGTAAQIVSARVRAAGWTVAVIDHHPLGGTCALHGCDPKKTLVSGEAAVDAARRMIGHGVTGNLQIDWPTLMAFKRSFTDPVPQRREKDFAAQGIDTVRGEARFAAPDRLTVDGQALRFNHALIAAGAQPVPLGIPGEQHVITSDDFMELGSLPGRIALIGGGYIAAEFAHLAARAGAKVTVLQQGPRMLPNFDATMVGWLMGSFATLGIDVCTGAAVKQVDKTAEGFTVHTATKDGQERTITADLVVHAAGRAPALKPLDLAAAGVRLDKGRLALNEFLQSVSNPRVYAAGDAAGSGPPLTPVSSHDAKVVAANLLEGNRHRPDYRGVPSVAFTVPPIAMVGISEEEAKAQGLRVQVKSAWAGDWFTARHLAEPVYGFKTLVDPESGRILGAHLVGPGVDEVINLFALAVRQGLTAEALKTTMFAYPTGASDIGAML